MKLLSFEQDQGLKTILQLSMIVWLIEILLIFLTWSFLPPQVPLFYSRAWGAEQLGTPFSLFLLPGLGLMVFLVNLLLFSFTPQEEKLIRQILISILLVFNFLSLITLIQIIRLAI